MDAKQCFNEQVEDAKSGINGFGFAKKPDFKQETSKINESADCNLTRSDRPAT